MEQPKSMKNRALGIDPSMDGLGIDVYEGLARKLGLFRARGRVLPLTTN
jgi:hypothetical protein